MPKYLVVKKPVTDVGETILEFDEDSFNEKQNCLLTGKQVSFQDGNLVFVYQINANTEVLEPVAV